MPDSAQRTCEAARRGLPLALLVACLARLGSGQGPVEPQPLGELRPIVIEQLSSPDPIARGEAALLLASAHEADAYQHILPIARDPAGEARIRGLLALGHLGTPGTAAVLSAAARDAARASRERLAAAYALGLLADDQAGLTADEVFHGTGGSGYRRNRELLQALLLGLAQGVHPQRSTRLRTLASDPSNQVAEIKELALRALARTPGAMDGETLDLLLESRDPQCRAGGLELLATGLVLPRAADVLTAEKLARKDPQAAVRAAALRALLHFRQPVALELGRAALRANDPVEAAAGVRICLQLGGGLARADAEIAIAATRGRDRQLAMLQACTGRPSDTFRAACQALATDPANPWVLRARAAAVLADPADPRGRVLLTDLFFETREPQALAILAQALARGEDLPDLPARLERSEAAAESHQIPARLAALVLADYPGAAAKCQALLADVHTPGEASAVLLRALRATRLQGPSGRELELVAPELAHVLR